jgi:hypothetical protein
MTWNAFLEFARGPGINVLVGGAIYYLVEYWPEFELLAPRMKRLVVAGLCLVIPLLATLLSVFSVGLPANDWANTWWPVIVSGFAAFTTLTMIQSKYLPK